MRAKLKPFIWIVILLVIAIAFKFLNIQERLTDFIEWVPTLGTLAPVVFAVIYALACVLFIPGSLLTLGAGAVFGVVKGSVIVSIASTVGATLSFIVGRYLARGWISKKVDQNPKFKAIDEAVAKEGWKIVGLTRLSPIFPFTLLNYGYGITKVSLKDYVLASWIGMMPGTVMYVYLGAIAGDIATMGAGRERTTGEWILYGVGLLATVIVTIYVTKVAKKALEERV